MYLEKVLCRNFRNFNEVLLNLHPNLNIFIGANGQGKTNLLEAIYLMATADSHRTSVTSELINWEQKKALIQLKLEKRNGDLKLACKLSGSQKEVEINDNPLRKVNELLGYLNVVLFSPEDLKLVKEGPANRRKFIDLEISQVNPYYHHLSGKYDHILKQRNNLLKNLREKRFKSGKNTDISMLEIWDEQLIEIGTKIIKKRIEVIKKLKILARLAQRQITNGQENLQIEYESSLDGFNEKLKENETAVIFKQNLVNNRDKEIKRGYTVVGPHRADLMLKINKMDVRKFGSQGQQRTVALALKLAELEFMKSETGEYPVLLLDDVFSELDSSRRKTLLQIIADKIQTIITTTDMENMEGLRNNSYKIYHVNQGRITERG